MKDIQRFAEILFLLIFASLVVIRVARYAAHDSARNSSAMPPPVGEEEEQRVFLTPAGAYTAADIEANGKMWPSEKYRGFRAVHDFKPQAGDRLCPITRTKANPVCTWTVNGDTYEFCCPPCIMEFVRKAKLPSGDIQPPSEYVARDE